MELPVFCLNRSKTTCITICKLVLILLTLFVFKFYLKKKSPNDFLNNNLESIDIVFYLFVSR